MNEHFYNGFIKRAQQHGIQANKAEAIYKLAFPIPIPIPLPSNLPRMVRGAASLGRGLRDARESMKRNNPSPPVADPVGNNLNSGAVKPVKGSMRELWGAFVNDKQRNNRRLTPEIKAEYPDANEWADLPKDVRWGGLEGRREYNQLREEEQGAISDFVPPPRLPMPVGPRLRVPGS
jgi:hypothetical protein